MSQQEVFEVLKKFKGQWFTARQLVVLLKGDDVKSGDVNNVGGNACKVSRARLGVERKIGVEKNHRGRRLVVYGFTGRVS